MYLVPVDLNIVLGSSKFGVWTTIDHDGWTVFIVVIILILSNVARKYVIAPIKKIIVLPQHIYHTLKIISGMSL